MRLSNLLWLVVLFIVLRACHTCQHPKMYGRRGDSRLRRHYKYYDSRVDDRLPQVGQYDDSKKWDETSQAVNCNTRPQQPNLGSSSCLPALSCPTTGQTLGSSNAGSNVNFASQPEKQQHHPMQSQPPQQQPQYKQDDSEARGKELRKLVQHLYVAQARVQLEATEIHKAQAKASAAQSQLEDSANHVRTIVASLHNAQQEMAAAAIRAQIAQLQLAAHDQLLFAARQDVDALSSQVVGLQAAEGIVQPKMRVDLRQPLQQFHRPTPVPMIITMPPLLDDMSPASTPVREDSELDPGYDYGLDSGTGTGPDADADADADANSRSRSSLGSGYDDGGLKANIRRMYS